MPTFVPFDQFFQDVGRGVHNLNSDTIKVALSNTAPDAAADATLSGITQISAGNGYSTGGFTLANVGFALDAGVAELTADDQAITASGGSMATWRYAVYYNDTPTSPADPLIGYVDRGSGVTLGDGETETLDHSAAAGILRLGAGTVS
jgi:hypothetical protein